MTDNIFFDLEFTGLHQKTTPISIGLVNQRSRFTFYAEFTDYDRDQVDGWIQSNVVDQLIGHPLEIGSTHIIGEYKAVAAKMKEWLSYYNDIVMIGDCLAYDWMLFCEMFGGALKLPSNISYIPIDISSILHARGIDPDVDRLSFAEVADVGNKHNALYDAYVTKWCYEKLQRLAHEPS